MGSTLPPNADRPAALAEFIRKLVGDLEPLYLQHNQAVWMANVTGDARHTEESGRLDMAIRSRFAQPEPYAFLKDLGEDDGILDPLLQRQLRLLLNDFRANQIPPSTIERIVRIEKSLESRFNNFRARLDQRPVTDNEIRELLRSSDDVDLRRRAWEASKQVGADVREELCDLVRLRNHAARELGFTNFYAMKLELDELDEGELFGLLDQLDQGTRAPFLGYKRELDAGLARRFGVTAAELRPWHYADPFFQEAPSSDVGLDRHFEGRSLEDITQRFFAAVGLPVEDLLERADLYEKPGKCQHAFCMCVDRRLDIRVLCNLRPNELWMGTMLHEYGHAAYDKFLDPSLPFWLRQPAHLLTTEASAMLFGRLTKDAAWLTTYAGVPEAEARSAAASLGRVARAQLLVLTRWCLVMAHMERALYRDPEQDLDRLWWDLVERFQDIRPPEGRSAPDWASKIHFSVAPVYYHNYMLGEMMASQLQRTIQRDVLGGPDAATRYVTGSEVGEFLKQRVYRTGKSLDWRQTLRQATGKTLSAAAFLEGLD